MSAPSTRSVYLSGLFDGMPFLLVALPFGMLFGVVATEAGLNLAEVMGFSILVIAGAAQFAALQLMVENAPVFIILATALVVNMRMAMYSAALAPYLGKARLWQRCLAAYLLVDQSYAMSSLRYENDPEMTIDQRLAYFVGVVTILVPTWYISTWLGAVLGASIPPEFGLDFALPITFLALVGPMMRTLAHMAAAATSVVVALAFAWAPLNLGLFVAAAAAMGVGAIVEMRMEARGTWK